MLIHIYIHREVQFADDDIVTDPRLALQQIYQCHKTLSRKRETHLGIRGNIHLKEEQDYTWYGYESEGVRVARQDVDYKWNEHIFDNDKCKMPRYKREAQWTKFTDEQLSHFGETGTVTVKKYKKTDPRIILNHYHWRTDGINKSDQSELFTNNNSRSKEDLTAISRIIPSHADESLTIIFEFDQCAIFNIHRTPYLPHYNLQLEKIHGTLLSLPNRTAIFLFFVYLKCYVSETYWNCFTSGNVYGNDVRDAYHDIQRLGNDKFVDLIYKLQDKVDMRLLKLYDSKLFNALFDNYLLYDVNDDTNWLLSATNKIKQYTSCQEAYLDFGDVFEDATDKVVNSFIRDITTCIAPGETFRGIKAAAYVSSRILSLLAITKTDASETEARVTMELIVILKTIISRIDLCKCQKMISNNILELIHVNVKTVMVPSRNTNNNDISMLSGMQEVKEEMIGDEVSIKNEIYVFNKHMQNINDSMKSFLLLGTFDGKNLLLNKQLHKWWLIFLSCTLISIVCSVNEVEETLGAIEEIFMKYDKYKNQFLRMFT